MMGDTFVQTPGVTVPPEKPLIARRVIAYLEVGFAYQSMLLSFK